VGGEGRGRPGRPVVIQVGPQCATYTRGSRGQQRLSGPGTLRSKVDPHPNMPHRSTGQARHRLHEAHQARATEREGRHTARTALAASAASRSVAPRSEVGRGTPGSHGRSDWTHSRHHGGHGAHTPELQTCQWRPRDGLCTHGKPEIADLVAGGGRDARLYRGDTDAQTGHTADITEGTGRTRQGYRHVSGDPETACARMVSQR
jgi:hypothetical protein